VAARGSADRSRELEETQLLRPFLNDAGSCASYLFGCTTHGKLAVVDPHADFVDYYLAAARAVGAPIVALFETHVQADHVSGLPALVERTGAIAYLPGFERAHNPLLSLIDPDEFAAALVADMPPRQFEQEQIVAANRSGTLAPRA
jgi:glyoxylase-like metal-dependent hydrolase (beta-lactamase superfamily II)